MDLLYISSVNRPYYCEIIRSNLMQCTESMLRCLEAPFMFQQDSALSTQPDTQVRFRPFGSVRLIPWPSQYSDI